MRTAPPRRHVGRPARARRAAATVAASPSDAAPPHSRLRTPHAGYHHDGSGRRFFEGWYFKVGRRGGGWRWANHARAAPTSTPPHPTPQVTLPAPHNGFALIYSVEDPGSGGGKRKAAGSAPGVGAQVMGPADGYLLRHTPSTESFWGDPSSLSLGACFEPVRGAASLPPRSPVAPAAFDAAVALGFQATPTWHQGRLAADDGAAPGALPSTVKACSWAFSVTPTLGWGAEGGPQRATAGWMAALPVFEPHWQVLMARGEATGWLEWGGERVAFERAPAYAEKNWGAGFPSRWWWVQCDAFDGEDDAAMTAVGATRGLAGVPGLAETVGMVGLHWRGRFFELAPWTGTMEWAVDAWGGWAATARDGEVEAELVAACAGAGTPLRAPTAGRGLAVACRDSFAGSLTVTLRALRPDGSRGEVLAVLTSSRAAVETGGGPWAGRWDAAASMREPLRSMARAGVDVGRVAAAVGWEVPGL